MSAQTKTADPVLCQTLAEVANAFQRQLAANEARENPVPLPVQQFSFPPLETLRQRFALSDLESSLILLLALEATYPASLFPSSRLEKSPRLRFLDLQSQFPESFDPRCLLEHAPLRYWKLIEPARAGLYPEPLISRPLDLDDRILAHLLDTAAPDTRLIPYLDLQEPAAVLTPAQRQCARAIAALWASARHFDDFPPIALRGADPDALRAIAWEAAREAGLQMVRLPTGDLPENREDRLTLLRLWQREALLANRSLFLDAVAASPVSCLDWIQKCGGAVVIGHDRDLVLPPRVVALEAPATDQNDRRALIGAVLNGQTPDNPLFVAQLAEHFDLGAVALYQACTTVVARAAAEPKKSSDRMLWEECRRRARPRLGPLVQAIHSNVTWDDLVLPGEQTRLLHEAVAQVRHRAKVYHDWGFAGKTSRGLNLTALFSGPSGSGKTLAAEVVANALDLDLLRVDLSAVVSKYIGETEEHLRQVFDAAEPGGAVLLFDEADALFSPRSEVTDSRDRNANLEVSYLLQRLECYRGLAILTTNFKENIDAAFLRRIRFHVEFPFPDRQTRGRIWRASFPPAAPLGRIDFEQLGRLSLTGGHIRNIALNAAFLAAREGGAIESAHIVSAARGEFRKSEKPVPEAELRLLATLHEPSPSRSPRPLGEGARRAGEGELPRTPVPGPIACSPNLATPQGR
jgi:AAA+ superfamily predicted ATPase